MGRVFHEIQLPLRAGEVVPFELDHAAPWPVLSVDDRHPELVDVDDVDVVWGAVDVRSRLVAINGEWRREREVRGCSLRKSVCLRDGGRLWCSVRWGSQPRSLVLAVTAKDGETTLPLLRDRDYCARRLKDGATAVERFLDRLFVHVNRRGGR